MSKSKAQRDVLRSLALAIVLAGLVAGCSGGGGTAVTSVPTALPSSTPKGRSRIVSRVESVTATGADVDVIATEHGVAELRGHSVSERARRIIEIAAPEQRETLRIAAAEMGL